MADATPPSKGQRRKLGKADIGASDTTPASNDFLQTPASASGPRRHSPRPKKSSPSTRAPSQPVSSVNSDVELSSKSMEGSIKQPKKNRRQHRPSEQEVTQQMPVASVDGAATDSPKPHSSHVSKNSTTTPAKQIYAGPTFHASPAASALPMPRFLSRSVPAHVEQPSGLEARLDNETSGPTNAPVTLESNAPTDASAREATPLDFFFNAQRAEQARLRNPESNMHSTTPPPSRWPGSHTPNGSAQLDRRAQLHRNQHSSSGKELFMMELDGTDDSQAEEEQPPYVPFRQRMDAAHTASHESTQISQAGLDEMERKAKSDALKKLLMSQIPGRHPAPVQELESQQLQPPDVQLSRPLSSGQSGGFAQHNPHLQRTVAELPGSPLRYPSLPDTQYQGTAGAGAFSAGNGDPLQQHQPPTHTPTGDGNSTPDVKSMEDSLRRILKMDS